LQTAEWAQLYLDALSNFVDPYLEADDDDAEEGRGEQNLKEEEEDAEEEEGEGEDAEEEEEEEEDGDGEDAEEEEEENKAREDMMGPSATLTKPKPSAKSAVVSGRPKGSNAKDRNPSRKRSASALEREFSEFTAWKKKTRSDGKANNNAPPSTPPPQHSSQTHGNTTPQQQSSRTPPEQRYNTPPQQRSNTAPPQSYYNTAVSRNQSPSFPLHLLQQHQGYAHASAYAAQVRRLELELSDARLSNFALDLASHYAPPY
jgi:hypothetical protein